MWHRHFKRKCQSPRRLAAWLAAQCVAHSQLTLPRAHVATRHVAQRLRALALSSWAARGCLVNRHPGRPSHHAIPASHAACVAPPSAPPTPPPFKSVRPLSRMRRARRRLRRPCLGLPSHWALGSASQDRRTGVGESCAQSRWGRWPGGPAAVALRHHCSRRCATRQAPS